MSRRAVVVSFDHLHLGYLGCYGNDWIETPHLDRLATQSAVFDRHFATQLDPAAIGRAWWASLDRLREAGIATRLFVESDGSDGPFVAPAFDDIVTIRGTDSLEAGDAEPPFARLVQAVVDRLPQSAAPEAPSLVWLKCRGVPDPWLPPREFADLYLDEFGLAGEPADDDEVEEDVNDDFDPGDSNAPADEAASRAAAMAQLPPAEAEALLELKYARALYAAYVSWLDRWLGKLLRELEQSPGWEETLLIVSAGAGQALGERGRLGERQVHLREEWIHTPLIVRLPERGHEAARCPALVASADLAPTLEDWLAGRRTETAAGGKSLLPLIRGEVESIRTEVIVGSPDEWGLRSDDFYYVERREESAGADAPDSGALFEKPSDRWDQSDVSRQHLDVVDRMRAALERHKRDTCAT